MKQFKKVMVLTLVLLLGVAVGVKANELLTWKGTPEVSSIKINLTKLKDSLDGLQGQAKEDAQTIIDLTEHQIFLNDKITSLENEVKAEQAYNEEQIGLAYDDVVEIDNILAEIVGK